MNRASSSTGWVRNPTMKSPGLDTAQASSYDLGWTFNPISGCLNNCPYCYARKLANGRLRVRYQGGTGKDFILPLNHPDIAILDPFYPRFWEGRLGEPIEHPTPMNLAKRKGIFVCDMSDLFGIGIPNEWTEQVMTTIKLCPYHRFYLLTKQPQNLAKFSPFPDNCWVGVTATNTEMLMRACSSLEYPIQAKVKYLSIEPFLDWHFNWDESYLITIFKRANINWLIIGAQTKPAVYPKLEWVQGIVEAADKAGIPVFLKDNLMPLLTSKLHGQGGIESHNFWAFKEFKLRQEMTK